VRFIKAQAYGNDFLIVPEADVPAHADLPTLARRLCYRHRGLGADGLIVARETESGAMTQLFNADGSRAEVSGNGVRCIGAWLVRTRRLDPGHELTIGTGAGPKMLTLLAAGAEGCRFRAAMGRPENIHEVELSVAGEDERVVVLRVGNPQCVVLCKANDARLGTIAAALAVHPYFPEGTNVELAEVESPGRVRILIWERGVGPTESSGTGACAAAVAAAAYGGAARTVDVVAPGGTQRVEWTDDGIWLTGVAEVVATGEWLAGLD
jgi:diaminopimelate epimerase